MTTKATTEVTNSPAQAGRRSQPFPHTQPCTRHAISTVICITHMKKPGPAVSAGEPQLYRLSRQTDASPSSPIYHCPLLSTCSSTLQNAHKLIHQSAAGPATSAPFLRSCVSCLAPHGPWSEQHTSPQSWRVQRWAGAPGSLRAQRCGRKAQSWDQHSGAEESHSLWALLVKEPCHRP